MGLNYLQQIIQAAWWLGCHCKTQIIPCFYTESCRMEFYMIILQIFCIHILHDKNYAREFKVFCFGLVSWFYPYYWGLLQRHWENHAIAPLLVKQPWALWVNISCKYQKSTVAKKCTCLIGTLYAMRQTNEILTKWEQKIQMNFPDSKVHGANMGPIWDRQDPGGLHVGPMNLAIWVVSLTHRVLVRYLCTGKLRHEWSR